MTIHMSRRWTRICAAGPTSSCSRAPPSGSARRDNALAPIPLHHRQQVAELVPLRGEISAIRRTWRDLDRDPLHDLESIEGNEFLRVVGENAGAAHAEVEEDLHADAPLSLVGFESKPFVRLDGV